MEYYLTRVVYDPNQSIALRADEYDIFHTAKKNLLTTLGIEEKFEILLENYLDFEQDLNDLALRASMFRNWAWSGTFSNIHRINRRIMNVLSGCRMYIDQIKHDISATYGSTSTQYQFVRSLFSREYDSYLGYRTMEALRNYALHRDFPVDTMSYPSFADDKGPIRHISMSCTVSIMLKSIEEDSNFKPDLLRELQNIGKSIDLKPMIREYVGCIWRIHDEVRKFVASDVTQWDAQVESALERFRDKFPQENLIAVAIVKVEDSRPIEYVHLVNTLTKRRKELEEKNGYIADLRRVYISSECEEDRKAKRS